MWYEFFFRDRDKETLLFTSGIYKIFLKVHDKIRPVFLSRVALLAFYTQSSLSLNTYSGTAVELWKQYTLLLQPLFMLDNTSSKTERILIKGMRKLPLRFNKYFFGIA